jgi:hypothetical protein
MEAGDDRRIGVPPTDRFGGKMNMKFESISFSTFFAGARLVCPSISSGALMVEL